MQNVELRTGLTAKQVGEFSFAARTAGQDVSIFEKMMRGLTMAVKDNSEKGEKAREWLGKFHVDKAAVRDGSASTAAVLTQVANGLNQLPTVWERNKAALDLFKKTGVEAIPVLLQLSDSLKTAKENGFGFSDEEIRKNAEYQKSVAGIERQFDSLIRKVKEYGAALGEGLLATGLPILMPHPTQLPPERDMTGERLARERSASDAELDTAVHGHAKRLNEALQVAREVEKELEAFEKQMSQRNLDPAARIFAQRDDLVKRGANAGRATGAALIGASGELAKENIEDQKRSFDMALKSGEMAAQQWDEVYKGANKVAEQITRDFTQWAHAVEQANREIETINLNADRSNIMAFADRSMRLSELSTGLGQEGAAINTAYQQRLALAKQLYDLDVASAEKELDWNKQRVDLAKAEADLKRQTGDAEIERELKIAELRRKQLDDLRGEAGGFYDSAFQGPRGLEQFGLNFIKGQGRTIFQNGIGDLLGSKSLHAGLTNKLFQGTFLGQDPVKTATEANTLATAENTAALRSVTGGITGGGGYGWGSSSALSTFSRFNPFSPANNNGIEGGMPDGYVQPSVAGMNLMTGYEDMNHNPIAPGSTVPSGGFGWGTAAGVGAALAGGGFGIYSGIHAGGAQGALTAAGSGIGAAGALTSLLIPSLSSTLGPIGMAVGLGLGLVSSLLGDPKKNRANDLATQQQERSFTMPTGVDYSMDASGRYVDSNYMGGVRTTNVNVYALDSKSFTDYLVATQERWQRECRPQSKAAMLMMLSVPWRGGCRPDALP